MEPFAAGTSTRLTRELALSALPNAPVQPPPPPPRRRVRPLLAASLRAVATGLGWLADRVQPAGPVRPTTCCED